MYADAEQEAINYLTDLVDVPVVTEVPDPLPERFIRVTRTGNQRTSEFTRRVQVTIECWDQTGEAAAERFANTVEGLLDDWEPVPAGRDGSLSGSYPARDDVTGTHMYVFTIYMTQMRLD